MSTTPPKPRKPAQIEASRRNEARSKDPKTIAGKARAAQNARTHGLTASVVLSTEDQAEYDRILDSYCRTYLPANQAEKQLVHEIADYAWRFERLTNCQTAILNERPELQRQILTTNAPGINAEARTADPTGSVALYAKLLHVLTGLEADYRRGLSSVTNTLHRIQAERRHHAAEAVAISKNTKRTGFHRAIPTVSS